MTREERVRATLKGQEVDRVPVSVWMHYSQYDQNPRALAEHMAEFNEKYDYDFIKMMPFGAYTTPDWGTKLDVYCDKYKEVEISAFAITCPEDYYKIEYLPPIYGTWGLQLQCAQHLSKIIKSQTPFMQTLFTPATTLRKMAGSRLLEDMKKYPEAVHHALSAITSTTVDFAKANVEAGVSGFFLATQCASYDYLDDKMFAEFCKPYDYQVINAYKEVTYFNVLHIHGENIMYDAVKNYPCQCLNWHDRHTAPDLKTARSLTEKTFLGGIMEVPTIVDGRLQYNSILRRETPEKVIAHIREAITMAGDTNFIVGPGCVADPRTPEENLAAVRAAVER